MSHCNKYKQGVQAVAGVPEPYNCYAGQGGMCTCLCGGCTSALAAPRGALVVKIDCNDDRAHRPSSYTVILGTADGVSLIAQSHGMHSDAESQAQRLRAALQLGKWYVAHAVLVDGKIKTVGPVHAMDAREAGKELLGLLAGLPIAVESFNITLTGAKS